MQAVLAIRPRRLGACSSDGALKSWDARYMRSKPLAPQELEVPSGLCGAVLAGVYGNTVSQPFLPIVM